MARMVAHDPSVMWATLWAYQREVMTLLSV